jgi:hydroxymethylbilane synthase
VKLLRIGSRGSALALAQSNWVRDEILRQRRDIEVELRVIKTSGDRFVDSAIPSIGGKGVFTREIEEALLAGDIDLAVHSMKDLPVELPEGLAIAAVPRREDARDVLVSRSGLGFDDLPRGAQLGTGSLRRRSQLLHRRADLRVVPIRGNVDTRLRKLDEGEVDALVLAAAGLKRMGLEDRVTEYLADEICVSAVAQGALAIESRNDAAEREPAACLHDAAAYAEVCAERALLAALGGGCNVPIGARARIVGDRLALVAVVANPDGSDLCRGAITGRVADAGRLGRSLAQQLVNQGADKFLTRA